jgi:glycosyltransferase involved in cell wall biosynthesis
LKIVVVSPQFPYPPRSGFPTRVYHLARQLAARHDVTLLSPARPNQRQQAHELETKMPVRVVEQDGVSVSGRRRAQAASLASSRPFSCREVYSRAMQRAINDLCTAGEVDVIQLESSQLCTYTFPRHTRIVLDEHDIVYELLQRLSKSERSALRRGFNRIEHARFRRFEQRCWEQVDGCVVTSDRELPIVQPHRAGKPLAVVPNGVDVEYFRPSDAPVEPLTVLFNGILATRPNIDAAHHLVEEIWPLVQQRCPDARLTLVGRASPANVRGLSRPGVVLTGEVPDIRPYLRQAAVVAVPIRIGGGTRLKVVEGLAMGKALVSTSLGCEGIAVRDNQQLLIRDGARAFASGILGLFENPSRAAGLGRAGRGIIEQKYSWDLAGERLEALYREVMAA